MLPDYFIFSGSESSLPFFPSANDEIGKEILKSLPRNVTDQKAPNWKSFVARERSIQIYLARRKSVSAT